ncbi:MAG: hypothetical protein EU530_08090 [Promethearchaeota archaeon]|nr:MAG: hypothetical protein EU530_08090 [Candidatus Lokiarchaeota archaeon]
MQRIRGPRKEFGVPVNLTLIAEFPVVINTDWIRTACQIHRQTRQLHIWIAIYHPYAGGFMSITYTNETVQVVFPFSGVWDIIAGDFSMEVVIS